VLELRNVSKRFGGVVATDDVTLEVARGEVHALIGPNGAGKTTLIAQISGQLAADSGRIVFDGEHIPALKAPARVRAGLARSYQVTSLFRRFTVLENLSLAVQARRGSSFSFWRPLAAETALDDEARTIAGEVGLSEKIHSIASNLAHGDQRALEVGLALATRPRLLLLDEPMAGMGPQESARMIALIEQMRERMRDPVREGAGERLTVLLVEHDMDAVFRLASRISVLVNGRLIASGTAQAIRVDPEVKKAYLGDELAA
jgi:branched-chain amino acid transport system ATP-binding protein